MKFYSFIAAFRGFFLSFLLSFLFFFLKDKKLKKVAVAFKFLTVIS